MEDRRTEDFDDAWRRASEASSQWSDVSVFRGLTEEPPLFEITAEERRAVERMTIELEMPATVKPFEPFQLSWRVSGPQSAMDLLHTTWVSPFSEESANFGHAGESVEVVENNKWPHLRGRFVSGGLWQLASTRLEVDFTDCVSVTFDDVVERADRVIRNLPDWFPNTSVFDGSQAAANGPSGFQFSCILQRGAAFVVLSANAKFEVRPAGRLHMLMPTVSVDAEEASPDIRALAEDIAPGSSASPRYVFGNRFADAVRALTLSVETEARASSGLDRPRLLWALNAFANDPLAESTQRLRTSWCEAGGLTSISGQPVDHIQLVTLLGARL